MTDTIKEKDHFLQWLESEIDELQNSLTGPSSYNSQVHNRAALNFAHRARNRYNNFLVRESREEKDAGVPISESISKQLGENPFNQNNP